MDQRKEKLLQSGINLFILGLEVESARRRLDELEAQGVSFRSNEMVEAYRAFMALDVRWKELEKQHLALRDIIKFVCAKHSFEDRE